MASTTLLFCPACKAWWSSYFVDTGLPREKCPRCERELVDKPLPRPREEIRPGVFAMWSESDVPSS